MDDKLIEACKVTSSFQRKKALEQLVKYLDDTYFVASAAAETRTIENDKKIIHLAINTLDDQIERCRTISLNILIKHYQSLFKDGNDISLLAEKLEYRMINEETEELRMEIMKLVNAIIVGSGTGCTTETPNTSSELLLKYCEKFMTMIKIGLGDRNYEQVDLCSLAVPTRASLFSMVVIPLLIRNLGDRHQKVRSSSIYALTALIECGASKCVETIISPNTNNHNSSNLLPVLSNDHAPNVRLALANSLAVWSIHSPKTNTPVIVYTLLSLMSSDIPLVIGAAKKALDTISNNYYQLKEMQTGNTRIDKIAWTIDTHYKMPTTTAAAGNWRWWQQDTMAIESAATRDFLSRLSKKVFQHLYKTYHDNELDPVHRETKIGVIYLLVAYLGFNATAYVDAILEMLMAAENDMMPLIRSKVLEVSQLVGYYCLPDGWIKKQSTTIKKYLQSGDNDNVSTKGLLLSSFNILNQLFRGLYFKIQQLQDQLHISLDTNKDNQFNILNEQQTTAIVSTYCQVVYNQAWYLFPILQQSLISLVNVSKGLFAIETTNIGGKQGDLIYLLIILQQHADGQAILNSVCTALSTTWTDYLNKYGGSVILNILGKDQRILDQYPTYLSVIEYIIQRVALDTLKTTWSDNGGQDQIRQKLLQQQSNPNSKLATLLNLINQ
ncbi:hypothetical protein DFA_11575 [Cavenderia fasciculata]|uniref:Dynein axonemal assembly factor 5 TPR repeats domain-containing protein n=1 Tax=Cavenderia fasciculata TaxID=261658 RepID=F4QDL7_CACFS|nr:uncharacterized protein DFA_11575 [Cavenderia fasciculata]EGG13814.1 hypothetical protein DFA_11575 [Cavenderia fasciculata]|eukprot:XP_004350522.1 hypothetical protein DFA_11575 [Cavenderia fasciculata]